VAAAQAGDRAALEELLRRHYDRVHAVCRRITGQPGDAADAAQEAMILVVRNLAKFDGRASFGTWVYRIATNASLDELRRRRRRPLTATPTDDAGAPIDIADPDAGQRIDDLAASLTDRAAIEQALAQLPEDFRIPVVMRDVADMEYADIAEALGVPIGTVKSRIARGRHALATALHSLGNHDDPIERPTERNE
jgi:RNA polymerase sigma-70 factor (ECF subfamily)